MKVAYGLPAIAGAAIGAPLAAGFFVMLFSPPAGLGPIGGAAWFTAAFFSFFVPNTLYGIPHYGLGPELTSDYHERSSLFAWRDGSALLGTLVASAAPSVLVGALRRRGIEPHEAERLAYFWFSLAMAVALVALYWILVLRVRENPDYYSRPPNPIVPGVRRVLRNRPFRVLLACYLASSVTGAIPGIFLPFYLQYVLGLENWFSHMGGMLLTYFGSGFLSIPVWLWLSRRFGKRDVWVWHYGLPVTATLALYFLPQVFPGASAVAPMYAILVGAGAGFAAGAFLAPSMQADVIDYDELYTGKRREAQYGALWAMATKFAVIPSASIPLAVVAAVGFERNVAQSEAVIWTIRAIYGLAPCAMSLTAMLISRCFPITEPVHRAVVEGIEAHRRGERALDPLTGRLLPPPSDRGVDEDRSWFLDHFTPAELRRALAAETGVLLRDSRRALAIAVALCVGGFAAAFASIGDLEGEPGTVAVIGVPFSGLALAAALFHAIRVRAAARVSREGLAEREVRAHLDSVER